MKIYRIYELTIGDMKYIGFTGQDTGLRLADHILSAASKGSEGQMVQQCIAENEFDFSHKYIGAYLDEKEALIAEIKAIGKVKKAKRLNNTPGGEGITMDVVKEGRKFVATPKATKKPKPLIDISVIGGWIHTPFGKTKWFNDKDRDWLKNGGKPAFHKESGYMILPYGHASGKHMYNFANDFPTPK